MPHHLENSFKNCQQNCQPWQFSWIHHKMAALWPQRQTARHWQLSCHFSAPSVELTTNCIYLAPWIPLSSKNITKFHGQPTNCQSILAIFTVLYCLHSTCRPWQFPLHFFGQKSLRQNIFVYLVYNKLRLVLGVYHLKGWLL